MKFLTALCFAVVALSSVPSVAAKKTKTPKPVVQPRKPLIDKNVSAKTLKKLTDGKRLNRKDRKEIKTAEKTKYIEMRSQGVDEVSNTPEAAALRAYKLRQKKRKGLVRKKEASLADILFPGVAPEEYVPGEPVWILSDLADSRKTPIPYEYYDLPGSCPRPIESEFKKRHRERKNLGSRLQGHDLQPAPFSNIKVLQNQGCTPLCTVTLDAQKLKKLRRLVERQYRVQMTLDQLPLLMRSKEYNYAVRGYPIGFRAPASFKALHDGELYLFNHLKFVITYQQDPQNFQGVRITGFDVNPISIQHSMPSEAGQVVKESISLETCKGGPVPNDPASYLALRPTSGAGSFPIVYSYEVQWVKSDLDWTNRWDVYLVGAPDDDLHYFSIVNSLMIVLFLTGAISTIMIRTLRKDIAVYNEMDSLEEGSEETGWKLVHGDVFRPPQFNPSWLCSLVGTGCQIGLAFVLAMLSAMLKLLNPLQKGQTLTALILLYVLCGSVAGYVSSRLYKFTDGVAWKRNVLLTAMGLPGTFVSVFAVLNIFLTFAGAATAVSFWLILALFLLWTCVSAPLVFLGAYFGLKSAKMESPTKTNQIARVVPPLPWNVKMPFAFLLGGILPFGSVCIELAFIMSALWLHQMYYVFGFLLVVGCILAATCAQVSMVMTYLQLCAEDHRWWWSSFWTTASGGAYLFAYAVWFLSSRLSMAGLLPVVVYLTYMGMISIVFGLFCGSVGFLASLWFTRTIYGAVKVD
jgi:transmembrane 9 superfamily protein 2/4